MAERVLRRRKREKYKQCFDEECQQVTTAKYVAHKVIHQKIVHQKMQQIIGLLEENRMYRNKKNNYSGNKLKELEHLRYMNESRTARKNLNRSHKGCKC